VRKSQQLQKLPLDGARGKIASDLIFDQNDDDRGDCICRKMAPVVDSVETKTSTSGATCWQLRTLRNKIVETLLN